MAAWVDEYVRATHSDAEALTAFAPRDGRTTRGLDGEECLGHSARGLDGEECLGR